MTQTLEYYPKIGHFNSSSVQRFEMTDRRRPISNVHWYKLILC